MILKGAFIDNKEIYIIIIIIINILIYIIIMIQKGVAFITNIATNSIDNIGTISIDSVVIEITIKINNIVMKINAKIVIANMITKIMMLTMDQASNGTSTAVRN